MNIFLYTGFENLLDRWVLKADDNVGEFVRVVSSCIFDNFFFFGQIVVGIQFIL